MAVGEDPALPAKYELVKLNVASGTQLATRAADVTKHLSKGNAVVVSLSTRSRNANKLVSIVEIAKRELKSQNVEVFQYNALSSERIQAERILSKGAEQRGADENAEDDSDDAFETMGEKTVDGPKMRVIPVLTVYLSTESVRQLKISYG